MFQFDMTLEGVPPRERALAKSTKYAESLDMRDDMAH